VNRGGVLPRQSVARGVRDDVGEPGHSGPVVLTRHDPVVCSAGFDGGFDGGGELVDLGVDVGSRLGLGLVCCIGGGRVVAGEEDVITAF